MADCTRCRCPLADAAWVEHPSLAHCVRALGKKLSEPRTLNNNFVRDPERDGQLSPTRSFLHGLTPGGNQPWDIVRTPEGVRCTRPDCAACADNAALCGEHEVRS